MLDRDELYGRTVGEFVIRERIGGGGFGAVYRCEQPALGREAVIKVLHHRLSDKPVLQQRFLREAQLASRLDHPYAAHVYAFGVERPDGLFWIAMEMVHGTTLARWLDERGRLPLDQLVPFFERVAEVVYTAHERGIVHRDLKPSNIMVVERAGRLLPKLLDFGIAKLLYDDAPAGSPPPSSNTDPTLTSTSDPDAPTIEDRRGRARPGTLSSDSGAALLGPTGAALTHANATLGSPPYMSPEQWTDAVRVEPRSDLYALGIIAYEALTGRRPFSATSMMALAELHRTAEVPPVGPEFSAAFDDLFRRALAKRPEDRPASALALAEALRTASELALTPSQIERTPGRRRWRALGLGAALLAGMATAAVLVFARPGGSVAGPRALPGPDDGSGTAPAPATTSAPAAPEAAVRSVRDAPPPATVAIHIESLPSGADVLRWPAGVKIGVTPWDGETAYRDEVAVFMIRKRGYADHRIEIDLRTGARSQVELSRIAPSRPRPTSTVDGRQPGQPVNPFRDHVR
jgi:serine/threonine-protein kinase